MNHRAAVIKVAANLGQSEEIFQEVMQLLQTLIKMQRILYAPEKNYTPALILRYYNQSWLHSILIKKLTKLEPKKLNLRKLFGVYFHNFSHAGLMLRIICGQSVNAEKQDGFFNLFKKITNRTSNYHPGKIIPNLLVCMQAREELQEEEQDDKPGSIQKEISKLAQSLPPPTNTRIPQALIKQHSREWQAHLQQISDYLLEGKEVWWSLEEGHFLFHDITRNPSLHKSGPPLHHFRSSTLAAEQANLRQCWEKCLEDQIPLPTHIIRTDLKNGTTKVHHTPYLGDVSHKVIPGPDVSKSYLAKINHDEDEDKDDEVTDMTPADAIAFHKTEILREPEACQTQTSSPSQVLQCETSTCNKPASVQPVKSQSQSKRATSVDAATTCTPPLNIQTQPTRQSVYYPDKVHTATDQYTPKSKLGTALEIVLEKTEEIQQFDKFAP